MPLSHDGKKKAMRTMSDNTDQASSSPAYVIPANKVADQLNADIILLNDEIRRGVDERLYKVLLSRKRRDNVMLILVTPGGDPDAAYKISRILQGLYEKFSILVSSFCKSAGTLCVLGAHEIVMDEMGELGPMDVQIYKKDELGELSSGLVAGESLVVLQEKAFQMFEKYFLSIKEKSYGQVTFRTATEIAAKLTVGLLEPLYRQIDPMHVGEIARSMKIGRDYGSRLGVRGGNLKTNTLRVLTETYSSHGFVIDRDEASRLFNNVRAPSAEECELISAIGDGAIAPARGGGICDFLSDEFVGDSHDESIETQDKTIQQKKKGENSSGLGSNSRRPIKARSPDNDRSNTGASTN